MAQPGRRPPLPRDARRIPVPAAALEQWLAEIDDPGELKATLRVVAMLAAEPTRRGTPPSLSLDDLLDDGTLKRASELGSDKAIRNALAAALSTGTLIAMRAGGDIRLLQNDEPARAYLSKAGLTTLTPSEISGADADPVPDSAVEDARSANPPRANIFSLHEQHIGTFGHGMVEQLKAAEEEYPASWIEDAFVLASEQGKRSWAGVNAILRTWSQSGKPRTAQPITDRQRDRNHDDGKLGDYTAPDRGAEHLESYRRRHGRLPWESEYGDEQRGS